MVSRAWSTSSVVGVPVALGAGLPSERMAAGQNDRCLAASEGFPTVGTGVPLARKQIRISRSPSPRCTYPPPAAYSGVPHVPLLQSVFPKGSMNTLSADMQASMPTHRVVKPSGAAAVTFATTRAKAPPNVHRPTQPMEARGRAPERVLCPSASESALREHTAALKEQSSALRELSQVIRQALSVKPNIEDDTTMASVQTLQSATCSPHSLPNTRETSLVEKQQLPHSVIARMFSASSAMDPLSVKSDVEDIASATSPQAVQAETRPCSSHPSPGLSSVARQWTPNSANVYQPSPGSTVEFCSPRPKPSLLQTPVKSRAVYENEPIPATTDAGWRGERFRNNQTPLQDRRPAI